MALPFIEPLESRQLMSGGASHPSLRDEFSGPRVNAHLWHIPSFIADRASTFYGRTQIATSENASPPRQSHGRVHLTLDTYNPTGPGNSFYGTELISNKRFKIGAGLDLSIRAKLNKPFFGGAVGGLFLYELKSDHINHDEVDFELLSNQARSGNKVLTNVYAGQPQGIGSPLFAQLPAGGKLPGFHTYRMTLYPNRVIWRIDGKVVRKETHTIPTGPLRIHLNLWAPDAAFADAYDASINPAHRQDENQRMSMDVDRVVLKSLG